ncbi:MAG: NAD-dependent epimerase/dehydratase family protein [Planctomycetota bacterium]
MRIFVTGASGYIGSAVACALARAGHAVLGLVRSPEKARELHAAEVATVLGTIESRADWIGRAGECEVLVHAAAEHSPRAFDLDRELVVAFLDAARAAGAPRLFLYTSGVWVYGDTGGRRVDESTPAKPHPYVARRQEHEKLVLEADRGALRTLVIRPGCVYGGSGSLTASWFASAASEGSARYVGEGRNRWSMVHRDDLARLYVLAAESGCRGEVFNATDRSRSTVRECAEAASRAAGAGGRTSSTPVAEAVNALGTWAECLALDQHVDSGKASRRLGWQPRHAGFVDESERCFLAWEAAAGRTRRIPEPRGSP